jgi:hypothetical protein
VGSLGCTENVQTLFELLPCSVEHVRWNNRDRIPDTGLQVNKSVNWCSENIMDAHKFLGNAIASLLLLCHLEIAY